ncbi:hypothetical protein BAE44_0002827, partial [Dichanthelium oligosanthes]
LTCCLETTPIVQKLYRKPIDKEATIELVLCHCIAICFISCSQPTLVTHAKGDSFCFESSLMNPVLTSKQNDLIYFCRSDISVVRMGKEARNYIAQKFSTMTFGDLLSCYILSVYRQRIE